MTRKPYELFPPPDVFDDVPTETDGASIPGDDLLEEMPGEPTPTQEAGSCWKCEKISAVGIVAPHPRTFFEIQRLPTCIVSKRFDWAICAVNQFIRFGRHEVYYGPDRRGESRPYEHDRRQKGTP